MTDQPIPDEAVEAACIAYETFFKGYSTWANWTDSTRAGRRERMRAALEAYEAAKKPAAP